MRRIWLVNFRPLIERAEVRDARWCVVFMWTTEVVVDDYRYGREPYEELRPERILVENIFENQTAKRSVAAFIETRSMLKPNSRRL